MKRPFLLLLPLVWLAACQAEPSLGCGVDARYRSVERLLEEGNAKLTVGDAAAADAAFERGLETLGGRYSSNAVIDDTGLVLAAIRSQQRADGVTVGAAQKGRILENRLNLYRDAAEPEGCR